MVYSIQIEYAVQPPCAILQICGIHLLSHRKKMYQSSYKQVARPMERGLTQVSGIDYEQILAPLGRFTSKIVPLATFREYGTNLNRMTLFTSLLPGELEEELYMEDPEGFFSDGMGRKVCKLR